MSVDIAIKNYRIYNIHNSYIRLITNSLFTKLSNEKFKTFLIIFMVFGIIVYPSFSGKAPLLIIVGGILYTIERIHIYDEKKNHRKRC